MEIVKHPNKTLGQKLKKIKQITSELERLIEAMRQTVIEANGIGLAANQVGEDWAVFVIDKKLAEENGVPDAYINPEITEFSRELAELEEGCLSLPDYWRPVTRPKKIKLKALDENGKKIKIKARGFLARVLQHEVDHINGVLIKDRVK